MAAPEYVPVKPMDDVRAYASPPRRPAPWKAERPGDLEGRQPQGPRFGWQGPDQGYALAVVHRLTDKLQLTQGEHLDDVIAGCLGVALKRASLFGRAPVVHDWTVAFTIWGYFDTAPAADLVTLRRRLFEEVSNPRHYLEQRRIVDAVPEASLRHPPTKVTDAHGANWQSLLDLSGLDIAAEIEA